MELAEKLKATRVRWAGFWKETIAGAESELAKGRRAESDFIGSEAEQQLADRIERFWEAHLEDVAADRASRRNAGWRLPLSAAERRRILPNMAISI
jgi:hypothetical protein